MGLGAPSLPASASRQSEGSLGSTAGQVAQRLSKARLARVSSRPAWGLLVHTGSRVRVRARVRVRVRLRLRLRLRVSVRVRVRLRVRLGLRVRVSG